MRLLTPLHPDDLFQNIARERAAHFGDDASHKPHLISSMSTSVVVSTTSDIQDGQRNPEANADFARKPRGYFADQFEVRSFVLLVRHF